MILLYLALGMAAVLLAAYPITALALRHAKEQEQEPNEPAAEEPNAPQWSTPIVKERYVPDLPPGDEFRRVGKFTEATFMGRTYRARRGDEEWVHAWAEYPSGESYFTSGAALAQRWKAAKRRKEWES